MKKWPKIVTALVLVLGIIMTLVPCASAASNQAYYHCDFCGAYYPVGSYHNCRSSSGAITYRLPDASSCATSGVMKDRYDRDITLLPAYLYDMEKRAWVTEKDKYGELIVKGSQEYMVAVNLNYLFGRAGKQAGDAVNVSVNVLYDGYMYRRDAGTIYVEITDETTGYRYLARVYLKHNQGSTMPICMVAGMSNWAASQQSVLCERDNNYIYFSFYTGNNPKQSPPQTVKTDAFMSGYGTMRINFYTFNRANAQNIGFPI